MTQYESLYRWMIEIAIVALVTFVGVAIDFWRAWQLKRRKLRQPVEPLRQVDPLKHVACHRKRLE